MNKHGGHYTPQAPVFERWASKVEFTEGCWLWKGALNRKGGYGTLMGSDPRKQLLAHRYAYETIVGPIPNGSELDHLCRVRTCQNPDHLEPVTKRENIRRGVQARNNISPRVN